MKVFSADAVISPPRVSHESARLVNKMISQVLVILLVSFSPHRPQHKRLNSLFSVEELMLRNSFSFLVFFLLTVFISKPITLFSWSIFNQRMRMAHISDL